MTDRIAEELGKAIANLGYPVGMGVAPHPDTLAELAQIVGRKTAEQCAKIADEIAESILAQEAWDPDDENYDMEAYEEAEYAASVAGSVASAIRKGFLT